MNRKLLMLGGVSILCVVLNHAVGWDFTAMFWWTDRYRDVSVPNYDLMGTPLYWLLVVFKQLTFFSVPAFLFISGYFIGYASLTKKELSWKIIGERITNLLIPYLLWSLVILVYHVIDGQEVNLGGFLFKLLSGKTSPVYYYVSIIIQLYVLAKWLAPFTWKNWKLALGLSALVQLISVAYIYTYFLPGGWPKLPEQFFTNYVFYFTLGISVFYNQSSIVTWLAARKIWIYSGLLVFAVFAVIEPELLFETYGVEWRGGAFTVPGMLYTSFFLFAFIAKAKDINFSSKALNYLGTHTYGIYMVHPLVMELASRATYHFLPQLMAYPIPFLLVLFAVGAGIPLLLMWLVPRLPTRWAYRYLFG